MSNIIRLSSFQVIYVHAVMILMILGVHVIYIGMLFKSNTEYHVLYSIYGIGQVSVTD